MFGYKDTYGWGDLFLQAASRRGIEASLFSSASEVPDQPGHWVFIHMDHTPGRREKDKAVARELSIKTHVKMIPTSLECEMYDDKVSFHQKCGDWAPTTRYLTTQEEAQRQLDLMRYPFISKSRWGAGSSNVRFIETPEAAQNEINLVFGPGLQEYGRRKQVGYLLWQDFCPNNSNDWRVIVIAKKYGIVLRRGNRPNVPFASGSGILGPIAELSDQTRSLLDFTHKFVSQYGFTFCGVDIVYRTDICPVILEITTGWSLAGYKGCTIFKIENGYQPTQWDGCDGLFDMVVHAILQGDFE